jgi:hypothetical protein
MEKNDKSKKEEKEISENQIKDLITDLYDATIDSEDFLEGDVDKIDYCKILYKATAENKIRKVRSLNTCMFNCEFEGDDAVMILFAIPINFEDIENESIQTTEKTSQSTKEKNMAEKIMLIIKKTEELFITLDDIKLQTVSADKFTYLRIIKKVVNK